MLKHDLNSIFNAFSYWFEWESGRVLGGTYADTRVAKAIESRICYSRKLRSEEKNTFLAEKGRFC